MWLVAANRRRLRAQAGESWHPNVVFVCSVVISNELDVSDHTSDVVFRKFNTDNVPSYGTSRARRCSLVTHSSTVALLVGIQLMLKGRTDTADGGVLCRARDVVLKRDGG